MSTDRPLQRYIREILAKLDAEHVHEVWGAKKPCETCAWLDQQPEWQAMKAEKATDDDQI